MTTLYPTRWGTRLVDLDTLLAEHHITRMEPEYAARLTAWLIANGGHIGIGGSWRAEGSQPAKPGFAPEGKSFHQTQMFDDGSLWFCAVDLVARNPGGKHRSPRWSEVPVQGRAEAAVWGVHCNVGAPPSGEPWHMQPIEIDGHGSWVSAGRPRPTPGHPFPGRTQKDTIMHTTHRRILDTRISPRKFTVDFGDTSRTAAIANVTIVDAAGPCHISVAATPATSIANGDGAAAAPNLAVLPLAAGKVELQLVGSTARVIVDLQGWAS